MTAVIPTDRPKSVRNSCVTKGFGGVFMLSRCFLDCSVGVGVFVTGLSQISSFFSYIGRGWYVFLYLSKFLLSNDLTFYRRVFDGFAHMSAYVTTLESILCVATPEPTSSVKLPVTTVSVTVLVPAASVSVSVTADVVGHSV